MFKTGIMTSVDFDGHRVATAKPRLSLVMMAWLACRCNLRHQTIGEPERVELVPASGQTDLGPRRASSAASGRVGSRPTGDGQLKASQRLNA
jgi:hypothetical protein